ncbi:hypothetical protein [Serratia marcescens]|uniref:phage tail fiber protein n=1 Tax=Serratia marcescens TaxID=615 RepID=UPI0007C995FD|nr:hypothetical protein [Serratia marcescens]OAH25558.1 hypothetical protein AYJ10_12705 [Serratia marcescens]
MWYTEGKITVTNKSPTVSATGTQWSVSRHGVLPGMIFIGPDGKLYEIQRVNSDTSLTISAPYSGPTAKDQAYAIITTYEGDLTQFSAKFSNLLASFGGNRQDLLNWLTAKGDVSITKDDGSKLTVPSLDKINQKASLATDAGFGVGPRHADDAYSNNARICRVTGASKNAPSNGSSGVLSLPIDGGPSSSYLAIQNNGAAWVGVSNKPENGVRWLRLYTEDNKPKAVDINVYTKHDSDGRYFARGTTATVKDVAWNAASGVYNTQEAGMTMVVHFAAGGTGSTRAADFRFNFGNGGLAYRSSRDGFGYEKGWTGIWSTANTSVDGNGFIKKASPIARLSGNPDTMDSDYLDGFTLSGLAAVNDEAAGVKAECQAVGVYTVTGSLGLAKEGWTIEVPQDINGNRLCFVETDTTKDGTITVRVSKRRFDVDTASIVAGEPMDIPAGRWIDLRLEMPVSEVEEAPEAVEETAALENVNVDPI